MASARLAIALRCQDRPSRRFAGYNAVHLWLERRLVEIVFPRCANVPCCPMLPEHRYRVAWRWQYGSRHYSPVSSQATVAPLPALTGRPEMPRLLPTLKPVRGSSYGQVSVQNSLAASIMGSVHVRVRLLRLPEIFSCFASLCSSLC